MRGLILTALLLAAPAAIADELADAKAAGMTALTEQRWNDAAEIYREALGGAPDDGELHYRLATALMNLGEDDAAIASFQMAEDLGFQTAGALIRKAQLHARAGRSDQALTEFEAIAATGFGALGFIDSVAEFQALADEPRYQEAYAAIRINRYPCMGDGPHRAFDFWIGQWDVFAGGQQAGTNSISSILGGCALHEEWASATGGYGESFNYYDPSTGKWYQHWIADNGTFIRFEGEARDGGIYYTAETTNPANGQVTLHRFQFTRYEGGDVRQYWETSTDGGQTYSAIWDARYVRMSGGDS